MKKFVFVMLVLLFWLSPCNAGFRALLVGINYENADADIPRLSGCVNDSRDMQEYMTQMLGIPATSIRILTEEQATRKAILAGFRTWLIEGTEPGDTVFFQYSGHGHQLPDPFGFQHHDPVKTDKPKFQKFAEAFVPYDTLLNPKIESVRNLILDTEIRLLLSELKGRKVHLFLDCCHSEGTSRDFAQTKAVTRYLQLPWDPLKTRFEIPDDFPQQARVAAQRGLSGIASDPSVHSDYTFFAAARYFQKAYEYPFSQGKNGAFSFCALQLLRANPGKAITNAQILQYAREQMHNAMGISQTTQEPVFHGPKDSEYEPFLLLTPAVGSSPEPVHLPGLPAGAEIGKTAVWLTGQSGEILTQVKTAIENSDFCKLDAEHPDVIAEIRAGEAKIHSPAGRTLKTLALGSDGAGEIMKSLQGIHIVRELAALENPSEPFAVKLWLDEPGKTQFKTGDRVTLFYKVDNLPANSKAYLTLLNVAPDGTVAILYPQKQDFHQGAGEKLYVNAEVIPGKVYSIPKTQADLKPGQNVGIDVRIRLEEGQEFFKAIVTTEPADWESLNIGEFQSRFKGSDAKGFVVRMKKNKAFWSGASLRAEVRP